MERPIIKDKTILEYVEYLEESIRRYEESPYVNTYNTIHNQVDSFNEQLTKGHIDLFADNKAKEFDRAWKYMIESIELLKKLDELRKLMNPAQQKEIEQQAKLAKVGFAERLALAATKKG